jgi:D-sedoheptulose 7-phosphate isomerase
MTGHTTHFLSVSAQILEWVAFNSDTIAQIDKIIDIIKETKQCGGRLFIIGMGGGAGHASHAVNDFRKLCNVDASTPSDNVSELTARANDEGVNTIFTGWLKTSRLSSRDCLFILSVGGGNIEKNVSMAIVEAVTLSRTVNAKVIGIVGKDGGFTAKHANACVVVPNIDNALVTPQTEGMQALLWHLIVSSPELQENKTKW